MVIGTSGGRLRNMVVAPSPDAHPVPARRETPVVGQRRRSCTSERASALPQKADHRPSQIHKRMLIILVNETWLKSLGGVACRPLRCPTRTTRRWPRVTPAYTLLPMSPPPAVPTFTPKQGQYLAFIYAYTRVLGRPPAEADLQRHFGVSPPSVHQMVLTLERAGLIRRQPGVARSIEVLVPPEVLPILR